MVKTGATKAAVVVTANQATDCDESEGLVQNVIAALYKCCNSFILYWYRVLHHSAAAALYGCYRSAIEVWKAWCRIL